MNYDELGEALPKEPDEFAVGNDINKAGLWMEENATTNDADAKSLRRWGFQQAIKDVHQTLDANQLLQLYQQHTERQKQHWERIYAAAIKRYQHKIDEARQNLKLLTSETALYDPTYKELLRRREELEKELKEMRIAIREIRQRMAQGKEGMMQKWMQEAKQQINDAVEIQNKVFDEVKALNKKSYDAQKPSLDLHIAHAKDKRTLYTKRLDGVEGQMRLLGVDGVNPTVAYLLMGIGTSVAAVAGYFFSNFTVLARLGNADALSFLLKGFFSAANHQVSMVTKIAVLLALVLLISAVSWLCFYFFKRFFSSSDTDKTSADGTRMAMYAKMQNEGSGMMANLKAGGWFSFWLQIAPIVIIIGILIILLSVNSSVKDEVDKLNASVEGVFAGTAIALGIAGIMCLYIMKIIEPRLDRKRASTTSGGVILWIQYNWELVVCMVIFVCCTISIVAYPVGVNGVQPKAVQGIVIPEFVVVCLLAAFPFAYGLRFRGLIAVSRFLRKEIDRLDYFIAECETPLVPRVEVDYAERMERMVAGVLDVVENKAMLLRGATGPAQVNKKIEKSEPEYNALKKIRNFIVKKFEGVLNYIRKDASTSIKPLIELADWEVRYFPEIAEELKIKASDYIEVEQEYSNVKKQIEKLDADTTKNQVDSKERKEKLNHRIEVLLTYIEKTEIACLKKLTNLVTISTNEEAALLDGFHLGIWYRENQLGPSVNYYKQGSPVSVTIMPSTTDDTTSIKLLPNGE